RAVTLPAFCVAITAFLAGFAIVRALRQAWGSFAGDARGRGVAFALASVALVVPAVTLGLRVVTTLPAMRAYADARDAQGAVLRAADAGATTVTVPWVDASRAGFLSHDPTMEVGAAADCWVNAQVATYYGVARVVAPGAPAAPCP